MRAAGSGVPETGETQETVRVTLGVDTPDAHADVHVGVALDQAGRRLGERTVPTTNAGNAALVAWASRFGAVARVGIEGTGSYGAGLARWLRAHGVAVVEVERPRRRDRQGRRRQGKSDPIDAEAPRRRRGRRRRARRSGSPRRATDRWKGSAPCGWRAGPP